MQKNKEELMEEIEGVLDVVRKSLALHRGGVDLIDVDVITGVVSVRMRGMCVGCPMAEMTVKMNIEETLTSVIPEVREVIAVNDV